MACRMIQTTVFLIVFLLGAGSALGQSASGGPRPIYLRADVLKWQLPLNRDQDEVFAAAISAGKELGLTPQDGGAGTLWLVKTIGKGAVLDEHCAFPIVNYYNWRPVESFADAQRRLILDRERGQSAMKAGRFGSSVRISVRGLGDGTYEVQGACFAVRRDWGRVTGTWPLVLPNGLVATSTGILEKQFLESFLGELGISAKIDIPAPKKIEPARDDPTRELYIAERCRTGVVVDPATRELSCHSE